MAIGRRRIKEDLSFEGENTHGLVCYISLVVQFYPWFELYFPLFWGTVMYDNEFETKENKIQTKDKIEPQHICNLLYIACILFTHICFMRICYRSKLHSG